MKHVRAIVASPILNSRERVALWISALALSMCALGVAGAQGNSRGARAGRIEPSEVRLDTTVKVERGTILDVTTASGTVVVRGWDRSEVEVRASSDRSEFQFSQSARAVRIEARRVTRARDDVSIQVRVPLNTRVVVSNTAGDVQVLDVRGEIDANLLSGDLIIRGASGRTAVSNVNGEISVSDVDGPIKVQTMTGEISLRDVRGDIELLSGTGEVSMSGIQANRVQADVTQGEIFFDGVLNPKGRYDFSTHNGDVHLYFPEEAGGRLHLQSFTGSLHSTLPLTLQADSSAPRAAVRGSSMNIRQFNGRSINLSQQRHLLIGSGGDALVSVTTFNGDVHISRGPRRMQKEN